jgi:cation-transporting ATPase E
MVPEGLVLLTSIAFAAAVIRLGRHRVLVQELQSVEGLARVDVVCIDKTGTLTEGRLAVERIERLGATDPGPVLSAMADAEPAPNATILAIADAHGEAPDWPVMSVIPFSSTRKWSAATFSGQGTWVIGAPEVLLPRGELRDRIDGEAERGKRVVVLGRAHVTDEATTPTGVEPVAIVVLGDRPRPDAARTLEYFAGQGVAVKVLSGDHPATVGAIAASLGLAGAEQPVDARDLEDAELAEALERSSVFGRVTPQQKRAMVRVLQTAGHTVAMTGDGVNDALAVKESDLGVAMGTGSSATRAVAQVVLLASTFDALPSVVDEGRRVLGNIERTSSLYLTKTVYAMFLSLATGVAGFVFPFLPRHFTLIGALTIGIPSFFLALAKTSDPFRPGYVRRVLRFSIPVGLLAGIATFLAYALAGDTPGVTQLEAQTAAVMTLTWVGLLVLTIVSSPLTPSRLMLVWGMGTAGVVALLTPGVRTFFALDPPPAVVWLAGIGIAGITWSFARLFVPEARPMGPRARRAAGAR